MYYNLLSNIPLNIDWRQILLHLLNLVILFLILYFLLYNPVKKFMEKRKKYYEEQDEKSKKTLAEAESERIIKSAEAESSEILKKAGEKADEIKKCAEESAKDGLSDVIAQAAEEKIAKACTVDGFLAENDSKK